METIDKNAFPIITKADLKEHKDYLWNIEFNMQPKSKNIQMSIVGTVADFGKAIDKVFKDLNFTPEVYVHRQNLTHNNNSVREAPARIH